jgi:hypothetical protein
MGWRRSIANPRFAARLLVSLSAIACAEGNAFPANRCPPTGCLAPQSQQALMTQALAENWDGETFDKAVAAQAQR